MASEEEARFDVHKLDQRAVLDGGVADGAALDLRKYRVGLGVGVGVGLAIRVRGKYVSMMGGGGGGGGGGGDAGHTSALPARCGSPTLPGNPFTYSPTCASSSPFSASSLSFRARSSLEVAR